MIPSAVTTTSSSWLPRAYPCGYQDTKLGRHPTRYDLDRISQTHPVILRHSSGHIHAVNSYIIEQAKLTASTPNPPGGAFDRDSLGVPNGVCREVASGLVQELAKLPSPTPPDRSQASLDSLLLKIHRSSLQIGCHANGDREIAMVLTASEAAQRVSPRANSRHRIEHCSVTNRELLERIRRDSVAVVLHSYIYEHGDKMLVYGTQRWDMMHPNRTVIEMGIAAAQHSDSPISAAVPLLRIQSLATRRSAEGIVIGEKQRISAEQAIRLWTMGGAYTSFEDSQKGSLEAGKLADLVVLSEDPTTTDVNRLKTIRVEKTMIGGKIVIDQ